MSKQDKLAVEYRRQLKREANKREQCASDVQIAATIDLKSVGAIPIEYAEHEEAEMPEEDAEEAALMEAAMAADAEEGY